MLGHTKTSDVVSSLSLGLIKHIRDFLYKYAIILGGCATRFAASFSEVNG